MDSPVKEFAIRNELCRRAGMSGKWLQINKIGVFPSQQVKYSTQDVRSLYATDEAASIFQVRQEVILFHPILRQLVNESSGTFINVQRCVELKQNLLEFSAQYRSIIRACLENLRDEVMRTDGYEKEQLENYVTIFYSVECIWHLCEILFIANIPGNLVIKYLLDWVRFHFPKHERKATILLSGNLMSLETYPDYWETVIGSLLQGRLDVVLALLALHSQSHASHFKLAEQALKSLPVYGIYEGVSLTEFNLRWKHWLVDTQSKIDAKMFAGERNLNFIMRLVVGEELAWTEVQDQCEAWYELLAAWLFYTEPTVKSFELGRYAKRCISRMNVTMHHLDRVLLAAMDGDVEVIKEIQHMTDNGWFVTHLTDLLFHAGQLEKWQAGDLTPAGLRESFLIEYGTVLMSHQSLWQIGLNYLDNCSTDGPATIELLLPKIITDSEAKVNKIIREATKRDLTHIVHSISKVQGVKSMRHGRYGNALVWALKSQDANFVSHLADHFLKEFLKTGVLPNTDLLNNLGIRMLASDRLIFLGKYYEFQKLYQEKNYHEAANALISLIASKCSPKYFWATLLTDALTLVECDELVLSSNDTYNLLNCLEERSDEKELQGKIDLIRIGIARHLASALTIEAEYT